MASKLLACLLSTASLALANTEKAIFLGPPTVNIPLRSPSLDDLQIGTLTPGNWSLRTHVEAIFPTAEEKQGKATWLLLDHLTTGQRYETRVCWAATQPTAFTVDAYELSTVWESPELMTSLYEYSMSRQTSQVEDQEPRVHRPSGAEGKAGERKASVLLLRILAAADYFSANETLMSTVPPVHVDIILDPFLLNVLPRSLVPTVAYVVAVSAVSLALARAVVSWIRGYVSEAPSGKERQKKQQ